MGVLMGRSSVVYAGYREVPMRVNARILLLASALVCALALSTSAAYASFGIEKFVAVNCKVETCAQNRKYGPLRHFFEPKEETPKKRKKKKKRFTQAGGRVPFGITDFKVNTTGHACVNRNPTAHRSRTSAPTWRPGLATNPQPLPASAPEQQFGTEELVNPVAFAPPTCSASSDHRRTTKSRSTSDGGRRARSKARSTTSNPKKATPPNSASPSASNRWAQPGVFAHTLIKGSVEWGKGSALDPKFIGTGDQRG